jgi:hypothetical protein
MLRPEYDDKGSSLARRSPKQKSHSKGKTNQRKERNQVEGKSSGKSYNRKINEVSKNRPSFFQRLFFSSLSWSYCSSSSVAKGAYDPSDLNKEKYNHYEIDEVNLSSNKNFAISKNRDSPRDQAKVTFSFDECDNKSIDLDKMFPVEDTIGGTSPRKSNIRPILKRNNEDHIELSRKENPATANESTRRYLGQLTFRENPLMVHTRSSSHNYHIPAGSDRPPLPVSAESSSCKHASRQLYLVPEALATNQPIPLSSPSFDESPVSEYAVPVNIYQQQVNLSLQSHRNVEDEDFRLAVSLAGEEMTTTQLHSSFTKPMSLSVDQFGYPPPPFSASPSIPHFVNHSSVYVSQSQMHSHQTRRIASFSPPASPKSVLNFNNSNKCFVGNDAIKSTAAPLSPSRTIAKQEPVRDFALERALRLSLDHQANDCTSGSIKRNQIIEEANESAIQQALRASLQEAQKQRQRLEIREKLALSRALVASVDHTYAL